MSPPVPPAGEESPGGKAAPLRISVIGPSPRFLSGISYYTLRLSNALSVSADVRPLLFREMLPARVFPGWKRIGEKLTTLRYRPGMRVREMIDWWNPATWAAAGIQARQGDVVIIEWWTSSVAMMVLAIVLVVGRRTQTVIEYHEVIDPLEEKNSLLKVYSALLGRLVRARAAGYVVHSDADRQLVCLRYRIRPERVEVIPHGLYDHYPVIRKEEARKALGLDAGRVVLFFGLQRPYKGITTLIRAFEGIPESARAGVTLLIAGEAWEGESAARTAAASPVRGAIEVIERYLNDEETARCFSAADCLVIPYLRASQSGVAHIGMAYGLPIIASRVGGLTESLGGYRGTTFVDPADEKALGAAILSALRDPGGHPPPEELRWEAIAGRWIRYLTGLVRQ